MAFIWDPAALGGLGAVRVEIDGRDLADLMGDAELPYAEAEGHPQIAGAYVGLRPWQLSGSLTEHFTGAPGSDLSCGPTEKTVLLGCECGEPGCWPLMARIAIHDREVVWHSFEQPHRRDRWSYDRIDALRFERSQYEAALADAEALSADHPPLPE